MSLSNKPTWDEQQLIDYLLGSLPEEKIERMDQASIADDEFAWRLKEAENNLVDSYVRGELEGETLERFRTVYLASAGRREKVLFAEALREREGREPLVRPRARWFALPLAKPRWAFAGLAAAALVLAAFLVLENARLRERVNEARSASAVHEPSDGTRAVETPAFLLVPPRRGAEPVPEFTVPKGAERAAFDLQLEPNDFAMYQVAMKRPGERQDLWRSGELQARAAGARKVVRVVAPAELLESGTYVLELSSAGPKAELIANYTFRMVVQ